MLKLYPVLNENPEPEYELMLDNDEGITDLAPLELTKEEYADFSDSVRKYLDWQDHIRKQIKEHPDGVVSGTERG